MHFQFFEANLSVNLRKDYSESQDFNFCKAISNNGCYNSLAVEKDDEGKVKSVLYSKKRLYGYGRDEQIMERAMDNKNLDQVYISIESDITSLKGEKVDKDTVLPKFKLTVSTVGHSELNSRELIFPKSIEESGINKADHQSLNSFLIDCFVSKIKNNTEDRQISDLFFETFSVLATDAKLLKTLESEATKVEREILLQSGELKSTEKIRHYLNKLIEWIFGVEQLLDKEQHSKISSFVNNISNQSTTYKGR